MSANKQELGLLCCVWDDPRGIMRMLDTKTITDFDYVCFFDGMFEQWKGIPEFPFDEVLNVVKDWGNTHEFINVYHEFVVGKTEAEKRNHMMARAYQIGMEWGLVVDADEIPYIDINKWNEEKYKLKDSSFGCHSIMLDNYGHPQRRPRLFNMREQPYLNKTEGMGDHSRIYSSRDGRDMAQDITKTTANVESITLKHDKEFYTKSKLTEREEFGKTKH